MTQCPYVRSTGEPDHVLNCHLQDGHAGPHEDYMNLTKGKWYVEAMARCPLCGDTFEQRSLGYAEPTLPAVRQG